MPKIAILTDTHHGVRNDSIIFHDYIKRFYDEVFFPKLESEGITHVIHLGDLVDRRKYINYYTLKRLHDDFIEPLIDREIWMTIIAGNHDTYFKDTNELNAIHQLFAANGLLGEMILNGPEHRQFGSTKILFLPWICDANRQESVTAIETSDAPVVMGHLELQGYEMFKGTVSTHGMPSSLFNKYDMVMSGHFHHRSSDGTVFYLGTPYEMTWADCDDPKGFHIFDTETRELEFVRNPLIMFNKFYYDDSNLTPHDMNDFPYENFAQTYVKIIVEKKTNPYVLDLMVQGMEKAGVHDLSVVDNLLVTEEGVVDSGEEVEDTLTLLTKYVESLNANQEDLTKYISTLYNEALTLD